MRTHAARRVARAISGVSTAVACVLALTVTADARAQSHERSADRIALRLIRPSFRIAAGLSSHPIGATPGDPWFTVASQLGCLWAVSSSDAAVVRGPSFAFGPEAGFQFDAAPVDGGPRATAGIRFGIHTPVLAAFLIPQFVAGSADGRGAMFGERTALRVESLYGAFGIEVAHQYAVVSGRSMQAVDVLFAIDPGIAVTYLRWLMADRD